MYDLVVIGAGPGGYVAAIKGAQLGMKVAVIEKDRLGGTCLNRGCIPTKTLLHSARIIEKVRLEKENGLDFGQVTVDFEKLYQRKNAVVEKMVAGIETLLKSNGITIIFGTAEIIAEHDVLVEEQLLTAKNILIASGGQPTLPPILGIDSSRVLTSDQLLAKTPKYKRLVIIGGGVIGVEFASIFQGLGCEVSIVEAADRLLPNFEKELSKKLALVLKKKGIAVYTKANVQAIQEQVDSLTCLFETSQGQEMKLVSEVILVATGRKAQVDSLFAQGILCEMDAQGIKVNQFFQTSIPSIYAIGDAVSGSSQLAHAASAEGVQAVLSMNQKEPTADLHLVPTCVYTSPEIAAVGVDEKTAKMNGIPINIGKYTMAGNGKSLIAGSEVGFIKIISHRENQQLLGAQMMCEHATDLISQITQMIHQKVTVHEALKVIFPHPTFSEGIGEALEATFGQSIHTIPKKNF